MINTTLFRAAVTLVTICLVLRAAQSADTAKSHNFERWEKEIATIEKRDAQKRPPAEGILFVGSSSIRLWDLPKSFPDLPVVNHGFGGSQIADSTHFASRLVFPLRPKTIVLYAGDNDLASGKTPAQVQADFETFVKTVREELPETKVIYIAIKPSIQRWKLVEKVREANRLIQEDTKQGENLVFVDVDAPMIGDDGLPRKELFVADGLHLSPAGYEVWSTLLQPHLRSKEAQ